jgi:flagellar basal body-associated protein FliL
LKPELWGSPLVEEEKYQEKPVKREKIIIIVIIIIIIQFNSIHLFTCLTTARYDQLQSSTKTQVNIKKQTKT